MLGSGWSLDFHATRASRVDIPLTDMVVCLLVRARDGYCVSAVSMCACSVPWLTKAYGC